MASLPRLLLVGTGGTIAGRAADATDTSRYQAGALDASALLEALPEAAAIAEIETAALFALDSKDITPEHWLMLAARLRERLADPTLDGIVITHGTDTLEETAFFLDLTLPRVKPVVLTAAMRPATARSADGPMNLLQALATAGRPELAAAGVLVAASDRIWAASAISKRHTHAPDALGAWEDGPLGHALGLDIRVSRFAATEPSFAGALPDRLPRVDVLTGYAGAPSDAIDQSPAAALVLALAGHGSVPEAWLPALARARDRGVLIIRASRVPSGGVMRNANFDDDAHGTLAAGPHSAWQARIIAMLALASGLGATPLQKALLQR